MKWKLILLLALLGAVSGALSVMGVAKTTGLIFLIFFALISSYVISANVNSKRFLHGFIVGLTGAVLNSIVIIIFFTEYSIHNPNIGKKTAGDFNMKNFFIQMIPLTALLWGVILGSLTSFFYLFGKKKN